MVISTRSHGHCVVYIYQWLCDLGDFTSQSFGFLIGKMVTVNDSIYLIRLSDQ